jgi:transcriptional regulator with XRE-family HTH domain
MTLPASRNPYPYADSIGAQVREERTKRNLSDSRLARMAGVSRRHMVELQKGANVTLSITEKVMAALGMETLAFNADRRLTAPATGMAAAYRQQVAAATEQLQTGVALILTAASKFRQAAPGEPAKPEVNTELATKASALIAEFGDYVNSLRSEEKLETLQRLAFSLLQPPAPARRRRTKNGMKG